MAASKKNADNAVEEDAAADAEAPKAARSSKPPAEFKNSTFAERAKASGRNKRVSDADSK